jgi:hypothetical protein
MNDQHGVVEEQMWRRRAPFFSIRHCPAQAPQVREEIAKDACLKTEIRRSRAKNHGAEQGSSKPAEDRFSTSIGQPPANRSPRDRQAMRPATPPDPSLPFPRPHAPHPTPGALSRRASQDVGAAKEEGRFERGREPLVPPLPFLFPPILLNSAHLFAPAFPWRREGKLAGRRERGATGRVCRADGFILSYPFLRIDVLSRGRAGCHDGGNGFL